MSHNNNSDVSQRRRLVRINNMIIKSVRRNASNLRSFSDSVRNNRTVVMEAIIADGLALQYAGIKLKDDYYLVIQALTNNGLALQYVSKRLQDMEQIVYTALDNNWMAVCFLSNKYKPFLWKITQSINAMNSTNDNIGYLQLLYLKICCEKKQKKHMDNYLFTRMFSNMIKNRKELIETHEINNKTNKTVFNDDDNYFECPICYIKINENCKNMHTNNYDDNNNTVVHDIKLLIFEVQCGHKYCITCINNWLLKTNSCPMCRNKIINDT